METKNHESYVSLEVAKLLKEAGFDWEICDGYVIYEDGRGFTTEFRTSYNFNGDNKDLFASYRIHKEVLSKPALEVAQRWLREVKDVEVEIRWAVEDILKFSNRKYEYHVESDTFEDSGYDYVFYEEALEAGIKKALEIIL